MAWRRASGGPCHFDLHAMYSHHPLGEQLPEAHLLIVMNLPITCDDEACQPPAAAREKFKLVQIGSNITWSFHSVIHVDRGAALSRIPKTRRVSSHKTVSENATPKSHMAVHESQPSGERIESAAPRHTASQTGRGFSSVVLQTDPGTRQHPLLTS